MFGFKSDLKLRVKALDHKWAMRETKQNCAKGNHVWELRDIESKMPWIRCVHCHKSPEKKS